MDAIACRTAVPATPRAASVARELVAGCLTEVLDRERLADATLAVSELVTNCVLHGDLDPAGAPIALEICCDPHTTRVDVIDAGSGFLAPRAPVLPSSGEATGRGLAIVSRVADRWGCRRGPAMRVWFEIDRAAPAQASPTARMTQVPSPSAARTSPMWTDTEAR